MRAPWSSVPSPTVYETVPSRTAAPDDVEPSDGDDLPGDPRWAALDAIHFDTN